MLCPALNGLRIRLLHTGTGNIYLVDRGQARHVVSQAIYNLLFMDWDGIWDLDVSPGFIDFGPDINCVLPLFNWGPDVYLDDGGPGFTACRHIANVATMDRYHFKRDTSSPSADPQNHPPLGEPISWVPLFNGNRVRESDGSIYLVDHNRKRKIHDVATFQALFGAGQGAQEVGTLDLPSGHEITAGSCLAKDIRTQQIYLIDRQKKRLITSANAMNYYGFAAGTVFPTEPAVLDAVPTGAEIKWPHER